MLGVLLIGGSAVLIGHRADTNAWQTEVLLNKADAAATTLIADGQAPAVGANWTIADSNYGTITMTVTGDSVSDGKRSITVQAAAPDGTSRSYEAHSR